MKERKDLNDAVVFANYLTHAEVASLIGCTRQTATTFINKMEEEGLLSFSRKEVRIPSLKKMQDLAQ